MKGIGIPVTGILPVTTATFIISCIATTDIIPVDKSLPYISFALIATLMPAAINTINNAIISIPPKNPVSSTIIEKIKSLYGSGIYSAFCLD